MLVSIIIRTTPSEQKIYTVQERTEAPQQTTDECIELARNFDNYIDRNWAIECQEFTPNDHIWVGARLVGVEKRYSRVYDRYEFELLFKGMNKEGTISISSKSDTIPYEPGKFYRFDIVRMCKLIYSMASSGMYYDPNLDALEHLEKCD